MNVERLHAIAKAINAELRQSELTAIIATLQSALANQVSVPQEPSYQLQVATSVQTLTEVLSVAPSNDYSPAWRQVVEELGAEPLLGRPLLDRITDIFARHQITLAVARDEITQISNDEQALATGLEQLLTGLSFFGLGAEELEPGEAEVGIMIPRPAVKDELPALGEEFEELQKILGPFLELAEGSRPPLKVRTISSSDFTVYVAMAPGAALSVATALDKILDVYKKILEIRAGHTKLAETGVPPEVLAPLEVHANGMMAEETARIANDMVDAAVSVTDGGRANELKIELRLSLNSLANRIDHGYNVEVRAEPEQEPQPGEGDANGTEAESSADRQALRRISELAPNLAFVNRTGRPILSLPEGETIHEDSPDLPEP